MAAGIQCHNEFWHVIFLIQYFHVVT
jgi:hypothetical protein